MCGLTKFKGHYIYYVKSMGRKIAAFFKDNLTMQQLSQEINKLNSQNFNFIFLD